MLWDNHGDNKHGHVGVCLPWSSSWDSMSDFERSNSEQ